MKTLAQIEDEAIRERLRHFKGNKEKTVESLGICIRTLYNKYTLEEMDKIKHSAIMDEIAEANGG